MTTRSTKLFLNVVTLPTGTVVTVYTVPANRRTIVRSVTVVNRSASPITVDEFANVGGLNRLVRTFTLAVGADNVFEVWRVLHEGDQIRFRQSSIATADVNAWLSGAELVV